MASPPKISVCIPTYNRASYLGECLKSIIGQSMSDFEIIVSDNCSTDSTRDVAQQYNDPRVRYSRNEHNVGVTLNRNRCLDLAQGEYICILGDDDVYGPRFLERESAMLDQHPRVGFVHCAVYQIDAYGNRQRLVQAYPTDSVLEGTGEFLRYLGGHNVCCSTVMVRRALHRQGEVYDPAYLCHDWLMWLQLAIRADVAYIAEPLVSMRVHTATTSSGLEPSRWCREFLAILEQGLSLAETTHASLLTSKDAVRRRAVRAQGNRFFIAAVAAITAGSFSVAHGYLEVLRELEGRGLSGAHRLLAASLCNRIGQRLLLQARRLRRARAVRHLPIEAAW